MAAIDGQTVFLRAKNVTAAEDIAVFITKKDDVKVGPVSQYRGLLGPKVGTVVQEPFT